jgi:hypothetical protein
VERVGRSTTAPKQRKTTQELDERTKARYSRTYTMGKVKQRLLSYLVFMPKPSTHRMYDPGSIVPHIQI